MPKISVVLPCYNVSKYIDKCIESLLCQTLEDIEFIFVDDCSPDDTYDRITQYKDDRIKIIRHEANRYTAEARNTGIKNATGEYISFIDPDDYIEPDFLEKLYTLAKNNNADIAKGIIRYVPSGKTISKNIRINKNKYNFTFMMLTGIYKRELFIKNHIEFFIDTICGQFPLVHFANKVVTCEDAIYNYVIRPGSCITSGFSIEKWQKLNIKGAKFVLDFTNAYKIDEVSCLYSIYPFILRLSVYGYNKLSKENKQIAKPQLNKFFDDFWNNIRYKDSSKFNKLFFNMRLRYA